MPCNHKFQPLLSLEKLDFEPETLIVGTFIPEWPADNQTAWFYGKTSANSFWDVLPRLYGGPSLAGQTAAEWKQFCHNKRIALTDVISQIEDADADNREHKSILTGYADKALVYNFDDFDFVPIAQLLRQHPTIKNVYLTRPITEAFWRHIWNPVMLYCSRNNIHERKLLTPTAEATYQHEVYNSEHPGDVIPQLEDYILKRWREEWHEQGYI